MARGTRHKAKQGKGSIMKGDRVQHHINGIQGECVKVLDQHHVQVKYDCGNFSDNTPAYLLKKIETKPAEIPLIILPAKE